MVTLRRLLETATLYARAYRLRYFSLIAVLLLVQMAAAYASLTSTEVITAQRALEEFRERQAALARSPAPEGESAEPGDGTGAAGAGQGPGSSTSGEPGAGTGSPGAGTGSPGEAVDPACEWVCATEFTPPEEGVYEWSQCAGSSGGCTGVEGEAAGEECFGPLCRSLPRTGQRYVAHTGGGSWNNVHIYAEEHREEFDLKVDSTGVYNHRYKVDIRIGPAGGGSDIRQDPPLKFVQFPIADGAKWSGSWKDLNGGTDADYAAVVAGREELSIGGAPVRTWIIEVTMKMKGPETTGDVFLRFWVAPQLRMTVQEFYDQDLETPDGPYRGVWMVTLKNLRPRR